MKARFVFTLLFLLSTPALAINSVFFPGPVQAPDMPGDAYNCRNDMQGRTSCIQINEGATVVVRDAPEVLIGFEDVYKSWGVMCNDISDLTPVECVASGLRAADKGLLPLVKGNGDNDLTTDEDQEIYESTEKDKVRLTTNDPNYVSVNILSDSTLTLAPGNYYFGSVQLGEKVRLVLEGKTEIHVNELNVLNQVLINSEGDSSELTIWVHKQEDGEDYYAVKLGSGSILKGNIYSAGTVYLSGYTQPGVPGTHLFGAITAKTIVMTKGSRIYYEPWKGFELSLSPMTSSTNTCSAIPITFEVKNDKGEIQTDISGSLTVNAKNSSVACWRERANGNCNSGPSGIFSLSGGKRTLWLQSKAVGTVNVDASFTSTKTGELSVEKDGRYTFNAGGFRFAPSTLVSGKPENLSIEAYYGDCDSSTIANYSGDKKLNFGNVRYVQPDASGASVPIKPLVGLPNMPGAVGEQMLTVNFSQGVAVNAVEVSYADAGVIAIPISEEVPPANGVSADGATTAAEPQAITPLAGEALLTVRPYTLAICNVRDTTVDKKPAPTDRTLPFVRAGESFSARIKPIIWRDGDANPNDRHVVDLSKKNYCSRPITPSFKDYIFTSEEGSSRNVVLHSAGAEKPQNGDAGVVSGFVKKHIQMGPNGYVSNLVRWSDVGSVYLRSKLVMPDSSVCNDVQRCDYLDEINQGQLTVGRFYPSHFSVKGEVIPRIVAGAGNGFTYLGQPFDGQYTINVMTADSKPVKNYHRLGDAYKAGFDEWAINPVVTNPIAGDDLSSRWLKPARTGWNAGSDGSSQVTLAGQMTVEKGEVPEPPFAPLHFAVGVTKADIDGTDFVYCDEKNVVGCVTPVIKPVNGVNSSMPGAGFAQGEFLFGRMHIEGFTATHFPYQAQTMPVAVEYFNGTRFVTNTRDNVSVVSTASGEKEMLFSDTADKSKQSVISFANGVIQTKVSEGRAEFSVSPPHQDGGLNREQFRYWQKLGEGALGQSWLQHNWQGVAFDDDPSAIGTFGFYRGSDRVIYKGEKNITLTGE